MLRTLSSSLASIGSRTSSKLPFRRTRNSIFGVHAYLPPFDVTRHGLLRKGIVHGAAKFPRHDPIWVCCRMPIDDNNDMHYEIVDDVPTCLLCVICGGCPACQPGHIDDDTMRMGKWETKDGRHLYPFEMDNTHLINSINKLIRQEEHFKDNWTDWVLALEHEARKRGLR